MSKDNGTPKKRTFGALVWHRAVTISCAVDDDTIAEQLGMEPGDELTVYIPAAQPDHEDTGAANAWVLVPGNLPAGKYALKRDTPHRQELKPVTRVEATAW